MRIYGSSFRLQGRKMDSLHSSPCTCEPSYALAGKRALAPETRTEIAARQHSESVRRESVEDHGDPGPTGRFFVRSSSSCRPNNDCVFRDDAQSFSAAAIGWAAPRLSRRFCDVLADVSWVASRDTQQAYCGSVGMSEPIRSLRNFASAQGGSVSDCRNGQFQTARITASGRELASRQ
jgi:hypothetical protein